MKISDEWITAKEYEDITYKKRNGVARIAFNRPEVRNAFRPTTVFELYEALSDAREDRDIGVILLSGEGPSPKDGVYALCSRKTIGTHHGSRSRDKHKSNRLKRRDTFDVQYGIRNLRGILSSLENLGQSPVPLAASGRPQHFRF